MISKKFSMVVIVFVLLLMIFVVPANANFQANQSMSENRDGPISDSVIISETGLNSVDPAVAYNTQRDEYLVVWYNDRSGNDDIQGQRIDANGKLLGPKFFISAGPGHDRRYPDVAYDSKNDQYLVVWEDYYHDTMVPGYGIRGKLVSGSGIVADPSSSADIIICANGGNLYTASTPAVAFAYTSSTFLVVWSETFHPSLNKDILGQLLDKNGVLQGGQIMVSDDTGGGDYRVAPDIAYNRHANRFLVVFQLRHSGYNIWGVEGQQVEGNGALWKGNFLIEFCSADATLPQVAALPTTPNNEKFLVTYELQYEPTQKNILYIMIEEDGTLSNKAYIAGSTVDETNPAVAASETFKSYLVTWTQPHQVESATWNSIFGKKLNDEGTKMSQSKYIWGIKSMKSAVAAGKNGHYLVVYDDDWLGNSYISGTMWIPYMNFLPVILH